MPCIFLENVPEDVEWNKLELIGFHSTVTEHLGFEIEVHIRRGVQYSLLTVDGEELSLDHGIHAWVYWHRGRNVEDKRTLGNAVYALLEAHDISGGLDITFVDLPKGQSFYYERKMVPSSF